MPQFSALLPVFAQDEALHCVLESIDHGESGCVVAPAGARIPLIASMAQRRDKTIYVVVPTGREAEETASALRAWFSPPGKRFLTSVCLRRLTPWRKELLSYVV